jgi:hypothetical protein
MKTHIDFTDFKLRLLRLTRSQNLKTSNCYSWQLFPPDSTFDGGVIGQTFQDLVLLNWGNHLESENVEG